MEARRVETPLRGSMLWHDSPPRMERPKAAVIALVRPAGTTYGMTLPAGSVLSAQGPLGGDSLAAFALSAPYTPILPAIWQYGLP